jgi:ferritin-like protein
MSNDQTSNVKETNQVSSSEQSQFNSHGSTFGRRTFMKRLGLAGAALPAGALFMSQMGARAASGSSRLTPGDVAILKFLAAAEILETDLWQQYTELALGNLPFLKALQQLDGDMPTYVNQNTRDEFSHQNFINQYLISKGDKAVNLEEFRTLPSSLATGSKGGKRLTNLLNLTVDTSWFNRYRFPGNPDFGDSFAQIVDLVNVPVIPNSDLPLGGDAIQFIANAAGFHFATIEQGGSSLYASFAPKVTSTEVSRIVAGIGGTEIMHFLLWEDKAGNAPAVPGLFPQLPVAPNGSDGLTFFPGDGTDPSQPDFTNQIMPAPCKFISTNLPLCSIIRPTLSANAGAQAAVAGLTASGLFNGQSSGFFDLVAELAEEADEARRDE